MVLILFVLLPVICKSRLPVILTLIPIMTGQIIDITPEHEQLKSLIDNLKQQNRYDLLLDAIGVPALQQLNVIAARKTLSRLVITRDFKFLLADYGKEVVMTPVHKAVYLLFLHHEEGIEFKDLIDHRDELLGYYQMMCNRVDSAKITDTINRLTDKFDNAIHEKCARIKNAFAQCMDQYQLKYYAISSHTVRHIDGSDRIWFERRKAITLPREFVVEEF